MGRGVGEDGVVSADQCLGGWRRGQQGQQVRQGEGGAGPSVKRQRKAAARAAGGAPLVEAQDAGGLGLGHAQQVHRLPHHLPLPLLQLLAVEHAELGLRRRRRGRRGRRGQLQYRAGGRGAAPRERARGNAMHALDAGRQRYGGAGSGAGSPCGAGLRAIRPLPRQTESPRRPLRPCRRRTRPQSRTSARPRPSSRSRCPLDRLENIIYTWGSAARLPTTWPDVRLEMRRPMEIVVGESNARIFCVCGSSRLDKTKKKQRRGPSPNWAPD